MTRNNNRTATIIDRTGTGLRWEVSEWSGFTLRRDQVGTMTAGQAAKLAASLRRRGVAVTVLGNAPGAAALAR